MTKRLSLLVAEIIICFAVAITLPASAQTLYEDGPINGQTDAWTINFGFVLGDTFTLPAGNSTVTGLAFGAWLYPGDVLESVQVILSTQEIGEGTQFFNGVVNFTQSNCFLNGYSYDVCTETGSFTPTHLLEGTYWVTLQNAIVNDGDPVYWDENSGIGCHSPGCPSEASNGSIGTLPAEAFTILGTTGAGSVPEPGSLLLFASGVVALGGVLRRSF